jgi:diguanylate cyclase (GGDEF)-like protein
VLLDCVRQVDTLARYGGDEFTILLVDTPLSARCTVAERIRRTVAETIFEGTNGAPIRLTISIGRRDLPRHSRDREGCSTRATRRCTGPNRRAATVSAPRELELAGAERRASRRGRDLG